MALAAIARRGLPTHRDGGRRLFPKPLLYYGRIRMVLK